MSSMETLLDFQSLGRSEAIDLERRSDEIRKGDRVWVTGRRFKLFETVGFISGTKTHFNREGKKQIVSYLVQGPPALGLEWVGPADLQLISFLKSVVGISSDVIDVEVDT